MKHAFFLLATLMFVVSCSNDQAVETEAPKRTLEDMKTELKHFEDSLKKNSAGGNMNFDQQTAVVYAEKCLAIKNSFPKSKEAPALMNKAHIIFSSVGLYQRSVVIADSLITMYPMYEKRAMVLESLASSYDIFIQPRRKEKVKYYYELLLEDNMKIPAEQRVMIEKRLQYVDLPFEEYIQKVNN